MKKWLQSQAFRYLFAGGLTTLINFVVFTILTMLEVDYRLANTLAFLLAVVFAYFVNEGYVFRVQRSSLQLRFKRGVQFFLMRLGSYVIDMALMILFVSILFVHPLISKIIVNIVVIILNYAISKFHIFKEERS